MNPTPEPNKPAGAEHDAASPPTAAHAPASPHRRLPAQAAQQRGWVALVGAGPGDEGLLTLRAADLLAQADLVVASPDLAARLGGRMRADAEIADPAELAGDARAIVKAAKAGQFVRAPLPG